MKISLVIQKLEELRREYGDVELSAISDRWFASPDYKPLIVRTQMPAGEPDSIVLS